ncbi:MAG: hypothetical protein R3C14_49780 [Caldilineaceae bacterium]
MTEETITLEVPPWVYRLSVITILITLGAAGYIYTGWLITAPVLVTGVGALLAWSRTTYRQPRKRRILPLYIALVIGLLLQALEQWYFGYAGRLLALFPAHFAPPIHYDGKLHLFLFGLCAISLFLLAGMGIFFHHPLGNYVGWFAMLHGIVSGALIFGLPLLGGAGFTYMPGMLSALVVIVLGVMGSIRLSQSGKIQGVLS